MQLDASRQTLPTPALEPIASIVKQAQDVSKSVRIPNNRTGSFPAAVPSLAGDARPRDQVSDGSASHAFALHHNRSDIRQVSACSTS